MGLGTAVSNSKADTATAKGVEVRRRGEETVKRVDLRGMDNVGMDNVDGVALLRVDDHLVATTEGGPAKQKRIVSSCPSSWLRGRNGALISAHKLYY